jgi:hypothetical protein
LNHAVSSFLLLQLNLTAYLFLLLQLILTAFQEPFEVEPDFHGS